MKKAEVERFIRENPLSTIKLMVTEMIRQFLAPQEFCFQVFLGKLPTWGRALGSTLTLILWTATFLGAISFWKRGEWQPGLLVLGILGFFLITGSISHAVGARLRFPADLVALPLASFGFSQLFSSRLLRIRM